MAGILNKPAVYFSALILCFSFSTQALYAEGSGKSIKNYQRIIPLSSPVYTEMDRLYLLAGKSRPSTARPWSADEALALLELLPDFENANEAEPEAADSTAAAPAAPSTHTDRQTDWQTVKTQSLSIVKAEIASGNEKTGEGKADYRITKTLTLEALYKANDDRSEWEHGYEERKALFSMPVEAWFSKNLYSTLELTIKEEYAAITDLDNNFLNVPSSLTELDWYFPFRAFVSIGGEHWNIQAGRDQASWGQGVTGNMLLSDYSEYYNLIRVTTYWDKFKYSAVYIGLDPWLTAEEKAIDDAETADDNGLAVRYENFGDLYKAFFGHRVEFRLRENLSLSLSEALIYGNKYINITELNPVFILHNVFTPEYSNAIMSLEADYTPLRGLNLYMQFVMDEFQVPGYEEEETRPGATGLLSGLTYVRPLEKGYLTLKGEAAMTEPYLYNRWHPLTRFTNRRRIWSTVLDSYEYINKPIGYEAGPDAVIMYASAGFERPGRFSASLDARYSLKGEMNSSLDEPDSYDTGVEASRLDILSGTVEKELAAGLHGTLKPALWLTLSSDIYWINIENYDNVSGRRINDLEIAVSAGISF